MAYVGPKNDAYAQARFGMSRQEVINYVREQGTEPPEFENWKERLPMDQRTTGHGALRNVQSSMVGHDSGADDQNPHITTDGGKDMGTWNPPSDETLDAVSRGIGTRAAAADGGAAEERSARAERRSDSAPRARMGQAFLLVGALAGAAALVYMGSLV